MKKIAFIAGGVLIIILITILFIKYYPQKGKLIGDIYLTMKSGDIKRATGVDVVLYKVDNPDTFLEEITNIKKQYLKPLKEAGEEWSESIDYMQEKINEYNKHKDSLTRESFEDGKRKSEEKNAQFQKLIAEHNSKINNILTPLFFKRVKANINGHYEFSDIPYGKYIVFSHYSVYKENVDWLFPIEINNKENQFDLTNINIDKLFFYSHQ